MSLLTLLNFIMSHPLIKNNKLAALVRLLKWQIAYRLIPYPIIYPLVDQTKLIVTKKTPATTMNLYTGLQDFKNMGFLLHFLEKQDLFIDVGANVGVYTLLASGVKNANSITVEPIPETFSQLRQNIMLNQLDNKVKTLNIGLGAEDGTLKFSVDLASMNHVLTDDEKKEDFIEVPIRPLDALLDGHVLTPVLLKIDTEGFETAVLQGAKEILKNEKLKAIMIELIGLGSHYGYEEKAIHELLHANNFKPFEYDPFTRKLSRITTVNKSGDYLYVRDEQFVQERLSNSQPFRVLNKTI